jgi:hypothetical protein
MLGPGKSHPNNSVFMGLDACGHKARSDARFSTVWRLAVCLGPALGA